MVIASVVLSQYTRVTDNDNGRTVQFAMQLQRSAKTTCTSHKISTSGVRGATTSLKLGVQFLGLGITTLLQKEIRQAYPI